MISITGATGTVGSEVIKKLSAQGIQARALTRDLRKVRTSGGAFVINNGRLQPAKNCPRTKPSVENRGSPTLRFGELFDFSRSFCLRHSAAWPATFQIIFKNDAICSFFKPCCNMSGQCFHIFISPSFLALSLFRIREILWCHLRCIDRSLLEVGLSIPKRFCPWAPLFD